MKAMTPRPFYRWKSFWLGRMVLLSLLWAWSSSLNYAYFVNISVSDSKTLSFSSGRGCVALIPQGYPPSRAPSDRVSFESGKTKDRWHWFQPPFTYSSEEPLPGFEVTYLGIAYWFLILLLGLVWSAWLFWHWKREKKKSS
jgi:hypothetical protein